MGFANWLKSFADKVATHYKYFPVLFVVTGLPKQRDSLANLQPSLMRIFRIVKIERLADEEVRDFIKKGFERANMKVEPRALDTLVNYSGGLPILMHELGDAAFWLDKDGVIDFTEAVGALLVAADNVGKKYLAPQVYSAIRSIRYRAILREFAKRDVAFSKEFTKTQLEAQLSNDEKKVLHNFLRRMQDLGVIESDLEGGRGAYRFVNDIYPVYIWMESERFERVKTK